MRELVRLPVAAVERDEDAHVVLAGRDLDGGAGELCGDLVEAAGGEAALGAADVEGADGRVVRGLLGEVGDADEVIGPRGGGELGHGEGGGRGVGVGRGALGGLEARGAARGGLERAGADLGRVVLCFPVTLDPDVSSLVPPDMRLSRSGGEPTRKNSPRHEL